MSELTRFSVSIDKALVRKFDRLLRDEGYPTRSKAIADLMREALKDREWAEGEEVAGAIILVYNHHKRELLDRIVDTQHRFHETVISTQHIHLDRDNCLEIIAVKGRPDRIKALGHTLKGTKGVKHCTLSTTTTGKNLP